MIRAAIVGVIGAGTVLATAGQALPAIWGQHGAELRFYAAAGTALVGATWWVRSYLGRILGDLADLHHQVKAVAATQVEHASRITRNTEAINTPPWLDQFNRMHHDLDILRRHNQIQLDDLNQRRAERNLPPILLPVM